MEINLSPAQRYSIVRLMKHLIKIAYDGGGFTGYQKGNGSRSVEDSILQALNAHEISASIRSAGRTDRGVSALSNCIEIVTDAASGTVTGILGSSFDDLFPVSHATVNDDFNVRHCDTKWYRYLLAESVDIPAISSILRKFQGTHDFRNFCRRDQRNTVRTIDAIEASQLQGFVAVDFFGRSFIWQQIRTIMGYALEAVKLPDPPEDPFSGDQRFSKPSPPENLILMDVVYRDIQFVAVRHRSMRRRIEVLHRSAMRNELLMGSISKLLLTEA